MAKHSCLKSTVYYKTANKSDQAKHCDTSYNWLVYRIHDRAFEKALQSYAKGVLLDIGCGEKPYRRLTHNLVACHLGLDHPASCHDQRDVDLFATAYYTGLADSSIDTIICTFVLEHLERPQQALEEMYRILKPGGHIVLSAPLFWHLHEEPRDFYRYTKHGLTNLFTTAGFNIVEIKPLAGFAVTFGQELAYFLNCLRRGWVRYLVAVLQPAILTLAYVLNRWDHSHGFTWAYLAVVRKNG